MSGLGKTVYLLKFEDEEERRPKIQQKFFRSVSKACRNLPECFG